MQALTDGPALGQPLQFRSQNGLLLPEGFHDGIMFCLLLCVSIQLRQHSVCLLHPKRAIQRAVSQFKVMQMSLHFPTDTLCREQQNESCHRRHRRHRSSNPQLRQQQPENHPYRQRTDQENQRHPLHTLCGCFILIKRFQPSAVFLCLFQCLSGCFRVGTIRFCRSRGQHLPLQIQRHGILMQLTQFFGGTLSLPAVRKRFTFRSQQIQPRFCRIPCLLRLRNPLGIRLGCFIGEYRLMIFKLFCPLLDFFQPQCSRCQLIFVTFQFPQLALQLGTL